MDDEQVLAAATARYEAFRVLLPRVLDDLKAVIDARDVKLGFETRAVLRQRPPTPRPGSWSGTRGTGIRSPPSDASRRGLGHGHATTRVAPLTGKWLLAYCAAVGDVFKALADPTRRTILDELTERDGQTLFEICTRLIAKHGLGSDAAGDLAAPRRARGRGPGHHRGATAATSSIDLDTAPLERDRPLDRPPRPRGDSR